MATNIRITAQDFVNQVTELQQRLDAENDRIAAMTPEQQIGEIQSQRLLAEGATLLDLQQKVQMAVLGQPGITIEGLSDDQAVEIQEKLAGSAAIIEGLENDCTLAIEIAEVSQLTQSLRSNPNPGQAASLFDRVKRASESHGFLNRGTNSALKTLVSALKAMTQPVLNTTQPPAQQNGTPAAPRHTQPTTPSWNQNDALEKNRQLKQAQDEEFQCSLFNDQFKEIQKLFTNDPVNNFNLVLAHYKAVHVYAINVPVFHSSNARILLEAMETNLERMLEGYIDEQAAKEEITAPAPQVQAQPQGQTTPLHVLKAALEAFNKSADISTIGKVKSAYDSLNANDKEKLFTAMNEIRKANNLEVLGAPYRRMNIQQWPGSSAHKLKAVENLLGGSSSSDQPAAPATPLEPKKADDMRRRFEFNKNIIPRPVVQPSLANNSSSQIPGLTPEEYAWINGDTSTGQVASQGNAESSHPNVATMQRLQHMLEMITPELSERQVRAIATDLYNMLSEGKKSIFQMSGTDLRSVGDRPFFHLYFIHKNEAPEKLRDDMKYGDKAFAGVYPGTTHEERARCVSRAIVELALENIEGAINFDNGELLVHSLNILEATKLNEKDRAEGHENAAHHLFGAFYRAHVAARNEDNSLVDPSDSRFQGDFGRHALRGSYNGVDPAIKLQTIAQVRNALKAVWKL